MPDWYINHSRRIDPAIGFVVGGLVFASKFSPCLASIIEMVFSGKRPDVYGAMAGIAGSLLGFTIASVSIVLTVVQMPRLQLVRESKNYSQLWSSFHSAIWWLGAATVAGLVGLALDSDTSRRLLVTALVSWIFVTAALRVFNAIWILQKIVLIATSAKR